MAKKNKHEEHANHEAWAIPYADLLTLLLAFFVVMYAISAVNEGKYRVLSDTLSRAFGGPPKSIKPVQVGTKPQQESPSSPRPPLMRSEAVSATIGGTMRDLQNPQVIAGRIKSRVPQHQVNESGNTGYARNKEQMLKLKSDIEKALKRMIDQDLVAVRRTELWLEVEIKADILFPSGVAKLSPAAGPILRELGKVLQPFPNSIRVEGYTDDMPIYTEQFPSNWELSTARASGVVHEFTRIGVAPQRLSVLGFGEYRPVADNKTADGRRRNRRVLVVVLADPEATQDWLRRQATERPQVATGMLPNLPDSPPTPAAPVADSASAAAPASAPASVPAATGTGGAP